MEPLMSTSTHTSTNPPTPNQPASAPPTNAPPAAPPRAQLPLELLGALELLALAIVLFVGAVARFTRLDAVGLWLDEILAVLRSEASPLSTAWTPGTDPQHGPLYHGVLAIAGHFAPDETGYRFAFALAGTLSLPLFYLFARRILGRATATASASSTATATTTAFLATAFVAFAPLHIFHSQDARPYTILLLTLIAGLFAIVSGLDRPQARGWYVAQLVMLAMLLLTSSQGFWFALILLACHAILVLATHHETGWQNGILRLGVSIALVAILFPALYGPIIAHQPDVIGPPPFSLDFAARMFQPLVSGYTEQDPATRVIYPVLLLAAIGAVLLIRRRRAAGVVVTLSFILGYVLPILALYTAGHGVRARYTLAALPGLAILVAEGVVGLLRPLARSITFRRDDITEYATFGAIATAVFLLWQVQQPVANIALASRANWKAVATRIQDRAHDGDLVIAANGWSQVCLGYYLPRLGVPVELQSADESLDKAKQLAQSRGLAFLVTGGWQATRAVSDWMGQYPEIYSSRAETIGVTFYPDRVSYMVQRPPRTSLKRDEQALWSTLNGQIVPGENGARFLLSGWSALEKGSDGQMFRWVDGTRADVYLPSIDRRPRTLTIDARAFPPIAARQQMLVKLNDGVVLTTPLDGAWKSVDIDVTAARWHNGSNQLSLEFAATASPSALMPGSRDPRHLSAAFRSLVVK
jgi:mannosyltransferase